MQWCNYVWIKNTFPWHYTHFLVGSIRKNAVNAFYTYSTWTSLKDTNKSIQKICLSWCPQTQTHVDDRNAIFVCLFTWGLFTCRVRWSIWAEQSLGRLLGACWTQREESSPIRRKKSLADDGHIINGFSVGMELICSDYCPLKGSLFLEATDASTSHNSLRESTGPAFPYCWFTPR